MTSISERFPGGGKLLTAEDVKGGSLDLQIDYVELGVPIKNKKSDVLHFLNDECLLVLNFTNAHAIARMFGDDCDQWHCCWITAVYDPNVEFEDKKVGGLRVRACASKQNNGPRAPKPAQQWRPRADDLDDSIPF
jgi:hypothetical protein